MEHRLDLWCSDSRPQGLSTNWGFNFEFSQLKAIVQLCMLLENNQEFKVNLALCVSSFVTLYHTIPYNGIVSFSEISFSMSSIKSISDRCHPYISAGDRFKFINGRAK